MKILAALFLSLLLFSCSSDSGGGGGAPGGPNPGPTPEESMTYSTGYVKDGKPKYGVMHFIVKPKEKTPPPANFSWEDQGDETPVRNQKSCGSCWAFGGTQTIEMGYKIFAHKDVDFSEQDLVGNLFYGCDGGSFTGDFQVSKGQLGESDCPYEASNHRCSRVPPPVAGQGIKWGMVGQNDRGPSDLELQNAILAYGTLSVTVGANNGFMNYKGGFSGSCPSVGTNHMVALTGWKTNPADGKVYFKIKNSWGTSWGEKGYGYFRRGCYNLAEEASWLAVAQVPCPPPAVKLPAEFVLNYGDDVVLAVKNLPNVTYAWYQGTVKVGDGSAIDWHADQTTDLMLHVANQCGEAEIKTLVTVKHRH